MGMGCSCYFLIDSLVFFFVGISMVSILTNYIIYTYMYIYMMMIFIHTHKNVIPTFY